MPSFDWLKRPAFFSGALWLNRHSHTAINIENLPMHEVRGGRGKINRGANQIVNLTPATCWSCIKSVWWWPPRPRRPNRAPNGGCCPMPSSATKTICMPSTIACRWICLRAGMCSSDPTPVVALSPKCPIGGATARSIARFSSAEFGVPA